MKFIDCELIRLLTLQIYRRTYGIDQNDLCVESMVVIDIDCRDPVEILIDLLVLRLDLLDLPLFP
jgi:hypothetical protein